MATMRGLGAEGYRALVPESHAERIRLLDEPTPLGPRRVAVVAADKDTPSGWLMVVAALLTDTAFSAAQIELVALVRLDPLHPACQCPTLRRPEGAALRHHPGLDLGDRRQGPVHLRTTPSGWRGSPCGSAKQLGLNPNQRGDLYLMGLLHDVGKIGIEDGVLKKPPD